MYVDRDRWMDERHLLSTRVILVHVVISLIFLELTKTAMF